MSSFLITQDHKLLQWKNLLFREIVCWFEIDLTAVVLHGLSLSSPCTGVDTDIYLNYIVNEQIKPIATRILIP